MAPWKSRDIWSRNCENCCCAVTKAGSEPIAAWSTKPTSATSTASACGASVTSAMLAKSAAEISFLCMSKVLSLRCRKSGAGPADLEVLAETERDVRALLAGREVDADQLRQHRGAQSDPEAEVGLDRERYRLGGHFGWRGGAPTGGRGRR